MRKITLTITGLLISLFSFSQVQVNGTFLRIKAINNLYIPHGAAPFRMRGGVDSTSLLWHNTLTGRVSIYEGKGIAYEMALMADLTWANILNKPTYAAQVNADWNATSGLSQILNKPAFLTVELDPIFKASPAYAIMATNINNWNTAYSWGNPALTYYPLTNPNNYINATYTGFDSRYYTQATANSLLSAKQNVLSFDSTPTAASTNPVTSQGIKAAEDLKEVSANKVSTYVATNTSAVQYPNFAALQLGLATKLSSASITGGYSAPTASIISAGTTTVTVTFASALPDVNYQAFVMLNGVTAILLGGITATITTKNTGSCVVTLKNTGLLTISLSGLTVEVIALKIQ